MSQLQRQPEEPRNTGYTSYRQSPHSSTSHEHEEEAIEEEEQEEEEVEEEIEEDDPVRARHRAAFSGCVAGGARAYITPYGGGGDGETLRVFGVGTWLARGRLEDPRPDLQFKPVVYCHSSLVDATDGNLLLASEHSQLIDYLRMLTGGEEPPIDLVAIATDGAAVEDWAPGDRIHGAMNGVLGAPCTWNSTSCILTAGHVTDGQPTVYLGGASATVRLEYHAGTSRQPLTIGPDFAVIELPAGYSGGPPMSPRTTPAGPSERLSTKGGPRRTVLAYANFMRVENRPGYWGSVYQLDKGLGGPGDSGTPVFDATGELAGHYVGSLAQRWAIVQDITYLVQELTKAGVTVP